MVEQNDKTTIEIKQLFPILSPSVAIQQRPPDQYRLLYQGLPLYFSPDAIQFFLLCDGTKSIYEIMQQIGAPGDADDPAQQQGVLFFLRDAEHKGWITFLQTRTQTTSGIIPIGSFHISYPLSLSIELTYRCNLRCKHCYINAETENQKNDIPTAKLLPILTQLHGQGLRVITLTGGEPMLHPDFFKILDFCIRTFDHVDIMTNGTLITEENAKIFAAIKQKLGISISLDGSTNERHEAVRGTAGCFEKTTKAIALLSQQSIKIRVAMATFPETEADVEPTLLLAKQLGAASFTFSPALPFGRANQFHWNPTEEEIRSIEQRHRVIIEKYKGFVRQLGADLLKQIQESKNCGAGYENFVVSPLGNLRACHVCNEAWFELGNLLQESPETIFSNPIISSFQNVQKPRKEVPPCDKCEYRLFCNGCWVRAINRNLNQKTPCMWLLQSGLQQHLKKSS